MRQISTNSSKSTSPDPSTSASSKIFLHCSSVMSGLTFWKPKVNSSMSSDPPPSSSMESNTSLNFCISLSSSVLEKPNLAISAKTSSCKPSSSFSSESRRKFEYAPSNAPLLILSSSGCTPSFSVSSFSHKNNGRLRSRKMFLAVSGMVDGL